MPQPSTMPVSPQASAEAALGEWRFMDMEAQHLEALLPIENQCYSHPWTRGNFADCLREGYQCQMLVYQEASAPLQIAGYTVAMRGVEEAHLLNIAVAPAFRGQGLAVLLLNQLCAWARWQQLDFLWLEVRQSNTRAQKLYREYGLYQVGVRKNYYPTEGGHEDALVMNLQLGPV